MLRLLAAMLLVPLLNPLAWGHPDKQDPGLVGHFAVGGHPIEGGLWEDETHHWTASVVGKPQLTTLGPTEALAFNGETDWLSLGPGSALQPRLPKQAFSVAVWINVAEAGQSAGMAGWMQHDRTAQAGWMLGTKAGRWCFALATRGSNGLTYLCPSAAEIEFHRWHYVVATYDGKSMRLFVDGRLHGESTEQSGEIVYPTAGEFTVGAFNDSRSKRPLNGALFDLKIYDRVLSADEIAAVARKNDNLIAWTPPVTTDLKFLVKPYLQFGTTESMVIMSETTRPSAMIVEYGERAPLTQRVESAGRRLINEVPIRGLKPQTSYFYRVTRTDESGRSATSELLSFQTAPPADCAWSFAVIGDTQRNPEVTRKVAEGAYALRPHFLLHCGDVVDDGHAKNQWVKDLFEPGYRLMSRAPTFPVIGNHEQNSHWYYDYFALPKPEYFYTFKYGNSQFFMIDSNKPLGPDSEQYQWLEKELTASRATWKFTCHHHPCFSSDVDDYGNHLTGEYKDQQPAWGDRNAQQIVPLYEKHGVDIAFNGHIHVYERTWPLLRMTINQQKGVRYVTSGGGGGGLEDPAPQKSWFSLHVKKAHHFCYATIHDRTIQFKAYDIEDRLFDTFELTKPESR